MEDDELKVKIESARSWFVLAQILIILAGFFYTTTTIVNANIENVETAVIETAAIKAEQIDIGTIKICFCDVPEYSFIKWLRFNLKKFWDKTPKYIREYVFVILFVVLSLGCWIKGRKNLNKIEVKK